MPDSSVATPDAIGAALDAESGARTGAELRQLPSVIAAQPAHVFARRVEPMKQKQARREVLPRGQVFRAVSFIHLTGAVVALLVGSCATSSAEPIKSGGKDDRPVFVSTYNSAGTRSWVAEAAVIPAENLTRMAMYEVTRYPEGAADGEQTRLAESLRTQSLAAAHKHGWFDFMHGLQDGYKLMYADAEHYVNEEYVFDDHVLDPDRPEFLMYYETPRGPKLAGFMFLTRRPEEHGPQIGGPLTVWHYHIWHRLVCLERLMFPVATPAADGTCARGLPGRRSPEMLHVWFVDHPQGPFATAMRLPSDVIAALAKTAPDPGAAEGRWTPPLGARFKPRFDGTAYDRKSGLTWEIKEEGSGCARCVDDQYSWTSNTNNPDGTAFTVFLDRLNNTCNGDGVVRCTQDADCRSIGLGFCGLGGFHDWRLPAIGELQGLLLDKAACSRNPCLDPSLPGATRADVYWSASADPSLAAKAGAVRFSDGSVGGAEKTSRAYVRAVRGNAAKDGSATAAPPASAHHHHDH